MSTAPVVRVFTPEILWHNNFSPILSIDYEPVSNDINSTNQSTDIEPIRRIVTSGVDKSIRIWTLNTDKGIKSTNRAHQSINQPNFTFLSHLSYHQSAVNVVKFSPDGRLIASADDHGSVAIWQRQGNEVIEVTAEVKSITDQPDQLATVQLVDQVENVQSAQSVKESSEESSGEQSDDQSAEPMEVCGPEKQSDDKVNSLSQSNQLIYHHVNASNQSLFSDHSGIDQPINPLKRRISPFTITDDDSVQQIEPFNSPKPTSNNPTHASNQSNIASTTLPKEPVKEVNLLADADDEIDSLCSEKWVRVSCFKAHVDSIYAMSWSPSGDMIATSCIDGQLSIWSIKGPRLIVSVPAHSGYIQGCVWDPLGQLIATVSNDRTCNLFQVQASKVSLLTTLKNSKQIHVDDVSSSNELMITDDDSVRCMSPTPCTPSSESTNQSIPSSHTSSSLPLFIDEALPSFFRRPSWSPDGRFLLTPAGLRVDDQRGGLPINRPINQPNTPTPNQVGVTSDKPSDNSPSSSSDKQPVTQHLAKSKDEVFCTYLYHRDTLADGPVASFNHGEPSIATSWSPHFYSLHQSTNQSVTTSNTDLCSLSYLQLFAVATTRAVYVYTSHDSAPIAVVSSIHLEQLTDLTWQHQSANQSTNHSTSQSINRILVTSIDGYVSVIELDHLFERISEAEESSIRAEMMSKQLVKQSNKPKRKRLRKLKAATDSEDEPVVEQTDNDEKPSVELDSVVDVPLLTAVQLVELQTLAASSTRITVGVVRSKYNVSQVKASKMWREFKSAQEQGAEPASASKSSSKKPVKESIQKSIQKSSNKKLESAGDLTDSDDDVIKKIIKPTPRKKAKTSAEPVTPAPRHVDVQSITQSTDESTPCHAPSTQRKSVKRKAVEVLPIDKGMKKLDCFFAAGDDDSIDSCEVMAVASASKTSAKRSNDTHALSIVDSEVKATPMKRAKTNESKDSAAKLTKSAKSEKSSKSAKASRSAKSDKSKTEKPKKSAKSKSKPVSSSAEIIEQPISETRIHDVVLIEQPQSPTVTQSTTDSVLPITLVEPVNPTATTDSDNHLTTQSPIMTDQPINQSLLVKSEQSVDRPVELVTATKKRLAPTLIDLLNAVPRSNSFSKRVTAPEAVLVSPSHIFKQSVQLTDVQPASVDPVALTPVAVALQEANSVLVE